MLGVGGPSTAPTLAASPGDGQGAPARVCFRRSMPDREDRISVARPCSAPPGSARRHRRSSSAPPRAACRRSGPTGTAAARSPAAARCRPRRARPSRPASPPFTSTVLRRISEAMPIDWNSVGEIDAAGAARRRIHVGDGARVEQGAAEALDAGDVGLRRAQRHGDADADLAERRDRCSSTTLPRRPAARASSCGSDHDVERLAGARCAG